MDARSSRYHEVYARWQRDPLGFWAEAAADIEWFEKPKAVFDAKAGVYGRWFTGGVCNTCFNAVDRQVDAGHGEQAAIIYDSPLTGVKRTITYHRLLTETQVLGGMLRDLGVGKGDRVILYMQMVPEAVIAMLACARIGAVHSVVFGGFAARELATRIDDATPKVILSASCGLEPGRIVAYKPLLDEAIELAAHKPDACLILQRPLAEAKLIEGRDRDWATMRDHALVHARSAFDCVPVAATDPLYILYTSGTTGRPKGVVRDNGGHMVALKWTMKNLYGVEPGEVWWTASDIGWVGGHSYIVYAPLLAGATTVLFEGKPIGTPDAGQFWRMIEEHKVTTMFTAPTALRAIRKEDPENTFFENIGKRGGMKQWRALFLAGERSEPSIVALYQKLLTKYAAPDARVIDNWWSSESGSPISGLALRPAIGKEHASTETHKPLQIKPGSAGKPMPGFDVRIVDDEGKEVKQGDMGNIVLAMPLGPTAFTTLFSDDVRFFKGYLKRFNGKWVDTGDAGMIDDDGYVHVMSRSDDIINVAAHRFSTGEC